jgi:hypothetical protein
MSKKIEIFPGGPPAVDQYKMPVSNGNKERVEWWSRSKDWVVVFDDPAPFDLHCYSPCNPGNKDIVVEPGAKEYKYTVYVEGKSADPIIILNPTTGPHPKPAGTRSLRRLDSLRFSTEVIRACDLEIGGYNSFSVFATEHRNNDCGLVLPNNGSGRNEVRPRAARVLHDRGIGGSG